MRFASSCWLLVLLGCATGTPPMNVPDAGDDSGIRTDSGPMGVDAGPMDSGTPLDDAGSDAGIDAGSPSDAGATDAGGGTDASASDAGSDAGSRVITIDGVIGAAEWAGVAEVTNTVATIWAGNELIRMLATILDGRLYLAVEGTVETTNAIAVYIDNDLGGTAGVVNLTDLTDTSGALDNALSIPGSAPYTTPATFRADYAWGTRDMSRSAVGFDASMGWRDFASNPADFAWADSASAPTTCSASACEAYIPLSTLGGTAPRTVALFARINNGLGDMSPNQTLPMDDASMPRVVSMLLTVVE